MHRVVWWWRKCTTHQRESKLKRKTIEEEEAERYLFLGSVSNLPDHTRHRDGRGRGIFKDIFQFLNGGKDFFKLEFGGSKDFSKLEFEGSKDFQNSVYVVLDRD